MTAAVVLAVLRTVAHAQTDPLEESWRWTRYSTTAGLPSNIVNDIKDGPDGTPWATTAGGLAWYDGYQWHVVEQTRGLSGLRLGTIAGFMQGRVVVSFKGGTYFATKSGIAPFPVDSAAEVHGIGPDSAIIIRGAVLCGYSHGMMHSLDAPWWKGAYSCGVMESGRLVVHSRTHTAICSGQRAVTLLRSRGQQNIIVFVQENAAHQGVMYVQSPSSREGLWEWEGDAPPRRDPFKTVRHAQAATVSGRGDACVVYENTFVRVRHDGAWRTVRFPDNVRDVSCVKYRRNGDLWVATHHGLFLCALSAGRWTYRSWGESDRRNRVNNILRSRDGSLWLATTGGVVRMSSRGSITTVRSIDGTALGIVTGLAEDRSGHLWISSGGDFTGAYRWDGRAWKHFPVLFRGEDVPVHQIMCDSKGRLWFLCLARGWETQSERNPGVYLLQGERIERWSGSDGLPHQRVYAVAEGRDGALWFGTFNGIARCSRDGWTVWRCSGGPVSAAVTALAVDGADRVWFGMQNRGAGIGMIDGTGNVSYFTTADGLPNDFVWDVKVDRAQRVWATTQKGLAVYDGKIWMTFDERTGFAETSIWPVLPEDSVVQVGTFCDGLATLHLNGVTPGNPRIVPALPVVESDRVVLEWNAYTAGGPVSPEDVLTRHRIGDGAWSAWSTTHAVTLNDVRPGRHLAHVQAKGLYGEYDEAGIPITFVVDPPVFRRWYVFVPASMLALLAGSLALLLHHRRRTYVRELGKSEARYRMITELMSDYAYLFRVSDDGTLSLVWMTDSFTRLTGYAVDAANEPDFMRRIIHPDDHERAIAGHGRLLSGEDLHMEHRIVTGDGGERWVERRSKPVFDGTGSRVEYIYGVVRDITARKRGEERLRSLAIDLVQTEDRERRRMATYLHDVIGQALTLCYLKLHSWQRRERPLDPQLDEIRAMLDGALQDAHTLTFDLCPPIIYELSLGEAFAWQASRLQRRYGVVIHTSIDEEKLFVSTELHVLLFQSVRELLVNSIKHAHASTIRLELRRLQDRIRITVRDDGVGFDVRATPSAGGDDGGFGLFNIRQRLADLGAALEIESTPGGGTRVDITVDAGHHGRSRTESRSEET